MGNGVALRDFKFQVRVIRETAGRSRDTVDEAEV